MYHSGVGGGGFMTVRSSKGEYEFIDFREMAPGAAFVSSFLFNIHWTYTRVTVKIELPRTMDN